MTKAVARDVPLSMYDASDTTILKTGLTLACTIRKDSGGFVATTNAAAEVGTSGVYALVLTATEMDADLIVVKATAAGGCDQVAILVTDEIAAIKDKTDTIGTLEVTVSSPVATSGDITLYSGDDYAAAHGRALGFLIADPTHALGLTVGLNYLYLKCSQATWLYTAVTLTTPGYTVAFTLTAAQTAAITNQRQDYELEAILADGDIVTLATGTLNRVGDIPAIVAP
jgi:hypothetical protein